jgi:dihydrofolate reductase
MKITIYIAASVNGFISNSRNVPDWLSAEYGQGFFERCQTAKAVIMGKKTYDILAPDHLPVKADGATVVLTSHTDIAPANPTVVFTSAGPGDIVAMLEKKGFSEAVIVGGASTMSQFINAGLVNDIFMVVEPILFGGKALPLVENVARDVQLKLVDSKRLNDSTLQLHYQITR